MVLGWMWAQHERRGLGPTAGNPKPTKAQIHAAVDRMLASLEAVPPLPAPAVALPLAARDRGKDKGRAVAGRARGRGRAAVDDD